MGVRGVLTSVDGERPDEAGTDLWRHCGALGNLHLGAVITRLRGDCGILLLIDQLVVAGAHRYCGAFDRRLPLSFLFGCGCGGGD